MKFYIHLSAIGFFMALPFTSIPQKKLMSLPFEFEKGILTNSEYDAYFLGNEMNAGFSLVLKDNKKVQYLMIDKNFKIVSKIDMDIKSTVFSEDLTDYRGGTTTGSIYQFIYEENKGFPKNTTVFQMERIDFISKTVKHQKLFEIPKSEKLLSSFSDDNMFYTITADDKTTELIIYSVNELGLYKANRIPFHIPYSAGRKSDKVSEYFSNLQVIKNEEEPDLSVVVSHAKLFSSPGKLVFVMNDAGKPADIFTIQLPSFNVLEEYIDFTGFDDGAKEILRVNSFLRKDRLFTLLLDNKTIRIVVHELGTGRLLHQYEISESSSPGIFAKYPVSEKRMGKSSNEKNIDDIKKLISALYYGTEGMIINENSKKQLIITIGTYNLIAMSSGGSGGGGNSGGFQQSSIAVTPGITNHGAASSGVMVYNPGINYRPGTPAYTTVSARYYTSTYFVLLMDSSGSKIEKGKPGVAVADQVKDYLELVDPKAKATNQFCMSDRQFYGYYDKDAKAYVIEEIKMRK